MRVPLATGVGCIWRGPRSLVVLVTRQPLHLKLLQLYVLLVEARLQFSYLRSRKLEMEAMAMSPQAFEHA